MTLPQEEAHTIVELSDGKLYIPNFKKPFDRINPADYLDLAEQLIESHMFRQLHKKFNDGTFKDITEDGNKSCAYFVSQVLKYFDYLPSGFATVSSLRKALTANGRTYESYANQEVPVGAVLYRLHDTTSNDTGLAITSEHIGFYMGHGMAISNSSKRKAIRRHDLEEGGLKLQGYYLPPTKK